MTTVSFHSIKSIFGDIFSYRRLVDRKYICDEYSIVDMACWPWVLTYKSRNIDLDEFPEIRRWYDRMKTRPALRRGYDLLKETRSKRGSEAPDDEARKHLFGATKAK
jgi:GST-like protein